MKVRDLKRLLETVSDETEIVVTGSDHSYLYARAKTVMATKEDGGNLSEYYGEPAVGVLLVSVE